MSNFDMLPSVDTNPATSRKELLDFVTLMPSCCTCCGRSGRASESLFCTWTCAMSGLVPAAKVRVNTPLPKLSLVDAR